MGLCSSMVASIIISALIAGRRSRQRPCRRLVLLARPATRRPKASSTIASCGNRGHRHLAEAAHAPFRRRTETGRRCQHEEQRHAADPEPGAHAVGRVDESNVPARRARGCRERRGWRAAARVKEVAPSARYPAHAACSAPQRADDRQPGIQFLADNEQAGRRAVTVRHSWPGAEVRLCGGIDARCGGSLRRFENIRRQHRGCRRSTV